MNHFVVTKRPFNLCQIAFMHGFIQSVGFCLPTNALGIDLVIPGFRSDGSFYAIVIQRKSLDQFSLPGPSNKTAKNITEKMTAQYIGFGFSTINESLPCVAGNELAKVIIQFREPQGLLQRNRLE